MSLDSSIREVARGGAIILAGSVFGALLEYFNRILLARHLGSSGFGIFSLGMSIMMIGVTPALFGLQDGIARFVSAYYVREEYSNVRRVLSSALSMVTVLSIPIGLIMYLFSQEIALVLFKKPNLAPALKIFSLVLPLMVVSQVLISGLRGLKQMWSITLIRDVFGKVVLICSVVILLFVFRLGLSGAVFSYVVSVALVDLLLLYFLLRFIPNDPKPAGQGVKRELFLFSWPLLISYFLGQLGTRSDNLLLGLFSQASLEMST